MIIISIVKTQNSNECLDYNFITNECNICKYGYYKNEKTECKKAIISNFNLILYVNSEIQSELEDGSISNPFSNLFSSFKYIMNQSKEFNKFTSTIYLFGKENHYLFNLENSNNQIYLFRRNDINLTIKPLFCNIINIQGCLIEKKDFCTINIKSDKILFFISNFLYLENIFFEGIDMHINQNKEIQNFYNSTICKPYYLEIYEKNSIYEKCYLKNKNIDINYNSIYGLFNLEYLFDCMNCNIPTLKIKSCEFHYIHSFSNKQYKENLVSLIVLLKGLPINILIENSIFSNIFLIRGLLTTYESNENYYLFIYKKMITDYLNISVYKSKLLIINITNSIIIEYNSFNLNLNSNETFINCIICLNLNNNYFSLSEINPLFKINVKNIIIKNNKQSKFIYSTDFSPYSKINIQSSFIINNELLTLLYSNQHIALDNTYIINNLIIQFIISDSIINFSNVIVIKLDLKNYKFLDISKCILTIFNCIFNDIISSFERSYIVHVSSVLGTDRENVFDYSDPRNLTLDYIFMKKCYLFKFLNVLLISFLNAPAIHDLIIEECIIMYINVENLYFIDINVEYNFSIYNTTISYIKAGFFAYLEVARNRTLVNVLFLNSNSSFLLSKLSGSLEQPLIYPLLIIIKCIFKNIYIGYIFPFLILSSVYYVNVGYDVIFTDNIVINIIFNTTYENNRLFSFYHFRLSLILRIIILVLKMLLFTL